MTASEITAGWSSRFVVLVLWPCADAAALPGLWWFSLKRTSYSLRRALSGIDQANPARNIWLTDSTGAILKPLTALTSASSASPAWSPNGGKIAFESAAAMWALPTSGS